MIMAAVRVLLGSLSSSFLRAYSVNVLICRDHGDRWKRRNGEGKGALGRQGEGRGSMQHCYFLFGSHSLSAPFLTDGGRGELVPRGCHHRLAELGEGALCPWFV